MATDISSLGIAAAALQGSASAIFKIARTVITVETPTITFSGITAAYDDLVITLNGASTAAVQFDEIGVRFNSDSGANYDLQRGQFTGTSAQAYTELNTTIMHCGYFPGTTAPANEAGGNEITMYGYNTAFNKAIRIFKTFRIADNTGGMFAQYDSGWWTRTVAVNRIDFTLNSGGNFKIGTIANLYGRGG